MTEYTQDTAYGRVAVSRVSADHVRLAQRGDGRRDEVYVPLSAVEDVIAAMRREAPNDTLWTPDGQLPCDGPPRRAQPQQRPPDYRRDGGGGR